MNKILFALVPAFIMLLAFTTDKKEIKTIELGTVCPLPEVKMKLTDGSEKSLYDLKQSNGLLVVFSCNTCPFVIGNGQDSEGWDKRYNAVNETAIKNKVGMVLLNSNHAKRTNGDGFDDMVERVKEMGFTMPYALDEESQLADAFGARTTPHVFLFDKNMKLVYRGSIDDNVKKATDVKEKYLEKALIALGTGKKIKLSDTKAVGCSIKRISK
jgi:thioredoxin-related protein